MERIVRQATDCKGQSGGSVKNVTQTGGLTYNRFYSIIGPATVKEGPLMEKRTYAASDQTRQALAAALKELMAQ